LVQAEVACGISPEGPRDVLGALGVDLDPTFISISVGTLQSLSHKADYPARVSLWGQ
jgi:hypothetical protein